MDPLSIAAGVVGLLSVCTKVASSLKTFHDGANIASTVILGLQSDVASLNRVLEAINDTVEHLNGSPSMQSTGHIGNHWKNIGMAIEDGQRTLTVLDRLLEEINKTASMLDETRRNLRRKAAAEEMSILQLQIRSSKDTLQLSLQIIILWNQTTVQESVDKIVPNLEDLHVSIRKIALDLNRRVQSLQSNIKSDNRQLHLETLHHLRDCVRSGVSVVSAASTTLGLDDRGHSEHGSEFGDLFPPEPDEAMLQWISSNTICENQYQRPGGQTVGAHDDLDMYSSDSDHELESEIIQAILKRGKKHLAAEEFSSAERCFYSCLLREPTAVLLTSIGTSSSDINNLLLEAYCRQEKWDDARSLLVDKLSLEPRNSPNILTDTFALAEVLLDKGDVSEAQLYGRRALKGYRRLGEGGRAGSAKSLRLLIRAAYLEGNVEESHAYEDILQELTRFESKGIPVPQAPTKGPSSLAPETLEALKLSSSLDSGRSKKHDAVSNPTDHLTTLSTSAADSRWGSFTTLTPDHDYPQAMSKLGQKRKSPPPTSSSTFKPQAVPSTQLVADGAQSCLTQDETAQQSADGLSSFLPSSGSDTTSEKRRKIVAVGDPFSGKTRLLLTMLKGHYPDYDTPATSIDVWSFGVDIDGVKVGMSLWDTGGIEEHAYLRLPSYADAHAILLCINISRPDYLDNVYEKWISEILHYAKGVPIILAGLQKDVRSDPETVTKITKYYGGEPVTFEQGEEMRQRIGATKYIECSAKTGEGVREVFEQCVQVSLAHYAKLTKKREKRDKKAARLSRWSLQSLLGPKNASESSVVEAESDSGQTKA